MPVALTYPGVYVEEIPSGVRTITATATSVTAFIGRARKGPVNKAVEITSYPHFERTFGGLWGESGLGYAVRDFYLNGGTRAVIVRLFHTDPLLPRTREEVRKVIDAAADPSNTTGKDAIDDAEKAKKTSDEEPEQKEKIKQATAKALAEIMKLKDDDNREKIDKAVKAARTAALPQKETRTIEIGQLKFRAASPGRWAAALRIVVERPYDSPSPRNSARAAAVALGVDVSDLFTLSVEENGPGGATETFANVTLKESARRVDRILVEESNLIEWAGANLPPKPADALSLNDVLPLPEKDVQGDVSISTGDEVVQKQRMLNEKRKADPTAKEYLTNLKTAQETLDEKIKEVSNELTDGGYLDHNDYYLNLEGEKKGLYALEELFTIGALFNLLCIPRLNSEGEGDLDVGTMAAAVAYCEKRRAMLIIDPPSAWDAVNKAKTRFGSNADNLPRSRNAAVFFPRLKQPNPFKGDQLDIFVPCGLVAGIFARTDSQRGVWKAPAGLDASLVGVSALSVPMTDEENGQLNPLGINCLRTFPIFGRVVWGARTLRGADDYADEYKYISVRRTALFIEESLYRGLKWVVFEPNDEPLWAQVRLNVGAFMHNLFRQGAFQGTTPREAYFVKCDKDTTTQNDINLGIVNIVVGFAPLKPAEFVVIKLQQMAGQIET